MSDPDKTPVPGPAPTKPVGYSSEQLEELFKYHSPTAEQIPKYQAINEAAKAFAKVVFDNCPASADRTTAIREIRSARMWANASVALDGKA